MQDQEKHPSNQTDDQEDFGLPEVNYNPVERENEVPPSFEAPTYYAEEEEEDEGPKRGWILTTVIGFFVLVGVVIYLFVFGGLEQIASVFRDEPQPPVTTQVPKQQAPAPQNEVVEEPEPYVAEEVVEVNPLAPYEGISTIGSPTGLSYIVIASFVDGDLANDFAMKMQAREVGVKIIQPTQRSPLQHRVAVAEFNSFEEAMQQLQAFRQEYSESAWVLKF